MSKSKLIHVHLETANLLPMKQKVTLFRGLSNRVLFLTQQVNTVITGPSGPSHGV